MTESEVKASAKFSSSLPRLNISANMNNNNAVEWRKWWQQFDLYLLATGLDRESDKRIIAIMLHSMGSRGLEIFNSFNMKMETAKVSQVKTKFDNYFEPSKNLTIIRHTFFTRKQKPQEDLNNNTTAENVIISLKSIFARHGIPMFLVSDGGPPFQSAKFRQFLHDWDIEHKVTSPYHAQSNGQAESSVKIIKNILKKSKETNVDPYLALLHYRNTAKNIFPSPAQLLMSRNLRINVPVLPMKLKPKVVSFSEYKTCFDKNQERSSRHYNVNSKDLSVFKEGENIYFKKKPNLNWSPGVVVRIMKCKRSYVVEDERGVKYRRNRIHLRPRKDNNFEKVPCSLPLLSDCRPVSSHQRSAVGPNNHIGDTDADRQMEDNQSISVTDVLEANQNAPVSDQPYRTRSGRTVKTPKHFY